MISDRKPPHRPELVEELPEWRRITMIPVTRLDGSELYVNSDLIEFVEATPDTVLSLTTGRKIVVRETAADLVHMVEDYHRRTRGIPAPNVLVGVE